MADFPPQQRKTFSLPHPESSFLVLVEKEIQLRGLEKLSQLQGEINVSV